tara:strand:- start:817 stop:1650 length:834 start_codon:yes stop_codon:yes gene_type:complete
MYISLKYRLIKFLEKIPFLQMIIYNNLRFLKFLLPHDKDYLGLKILFNLDENRTFVDVGGNIGISSMSFRQMGYKKNEILIFEPDKDLIKKHLNRLKNYYSKLIIFPFGLSNKNQSKVLHKAEYKNLLIHLNNSFSKKYILDKIKNNYPKIYKDFNYKQKIYSLKKFDDIKYKKDICFIKIDVEGYDHLVIEGMKNYLKKHKPIFLVEFNRSNFLDIWKNLKKNYFCYSFNVEKNCFNKFSNEKILRLISGHIFDKIYNKNSINLFLIPKKFKFEIN